MSRKEYVKPCILNKEELVPDQAIAACTDGQAGYTLSFMGWGSADQGGAYSKLYKDYADAETAYHSNPYYKQRIIAVWDVLNKDGSHFCYLEDYEEYGTIDGNDIIQGGINAPAEAGDNWQNVWGDLAGSMHFVS